MSDLVHELREHADYIEKKQWAGEDNARYLRRAANEIAALRRKVARLEQERAA